MGHVVDRVGVGEGMDVGVCVGARAVGTVAVTGAGVGVAGAERDVAAGTLISVTVAVLRAQEDDDDEGKRGGRRRDDGGFWSWFAGFLVDQIVPIAVAETEQADTRSWVLLPAEIWMARIPVEPGAYEVLVRPEGAASVSLGTVEVPPGGKAFRSCRVFGSPHPMRCD